MRRVLSRLLRIMERRRSHIVKGSMAIGWTLVCLGACCVDSAVNWPFYLMIGVGLVFLLIAGVNYETEIE